MDKKLIEIQMGWVKRASNMGREDNYIRMLDDTTDFYLASNRADEALKNKWKKIKKMQKNT